MCRALAWVCVIVAGSSWGGLGAGGSYAGKTLRSGALVGRSVLPGLLAEQLTLNQRFRGSSPLRLTVTVVRDGR